MADDPDVPIPNIGETGRALVALNGAGTVAAATLLSVQHISMIGLKIAGGAFLFGVLVGMFSWVLHATAQFSLARGQLARRDGQPTAVLNKIYNEVQDDRRKGAIATAVAATLFVAGAIATYVAALFVW